MAKTYTAPYTQDSKIDGVVLTGANTGRDGSGSISTLCTVGSNDGNIKRIRWKPAQATAAAIGAKVFLLFWSTDGGTTWNFYDEVAMVTSTPSTTAVGQTAIMSFPDGLNLPASAKLGTAQTVYAGVQDRTQVTVERSDY